MGVTIGPSQVDAINLPCFSKYEDLLIGEQIEDYSMQEFSLMPQPSETTNLRKEEKVLRQPDPLDRLLSRVYCLLLNIKHISMVVSLVSMVSMRTLFLNPSVA